MKKYDKYTDEKFKDAAALERFYKAGNTLKYDYVIVGGKLFTMEEYDMDGQLLVYANRKYALQLSVETSNRYKNGFIDAKVYLTPAYSWRNDIAYAE